VQSAEEDVLVGRSHPEVVAGDLGLGLELDGVQRHHVDEREDEGSPAGCRETVEILTRNLKKGG
jgi:hypothetical protein